MTLDELPISYRAAQVACLGSAVALRAAGPAACKLAPAVYVPLVGELEKAAAVFGILEKIREERLAARDQGRAAS